MTGILPLDIAIIAASVLGGIAAALKVGQWAWRTNRRFVHIYDAVSELMPNGGESVRDRVERIDKRGTHTEQLVAELKRQHRDDTAALWQAIAISSHNGQAGDG